MEVLRRFQKGDIVAFESLFRQFQSDVYGWIVLIVRDRSVAEDLTIETFWRIYQARKRFNPDLGFAGWARRIATRMAIDYIRTRRPEGPISERIAPCQVEPDPAVRREERAMILRAFQRLPPKLQMAATLALIEERPYEEIAAALGKPVGAVRTRCVAKNVSDCSNLRTGVNAWEFGARLKVNKTTSAVLRAVRTDSEPCRSITLSAASMARCA